MSEERLFRAIDRSDEELMAAFQQGDLSAFDALYRRYDPRLRSFFISLGHRQDAAEDLAQETFCRVIGAKGQFDRDLGCFAQWIFGIAHNKRLGLFRRFTSTAKMLVRYAATAIQEEMPAPLVDERFLVEECLSLLTDIDRTIIELTIFQGFTLIEVSRIINMPPGTIGRRKVAAIAKLRRKLEVQPRPAPETFL